MYPDRILTKKDCERLQKVIESRATKNVSEEQSLSIIKSYLTRVKPIDSKQVRPDVVTMNSKVCLRNIGNGKKQIFSLVYPDDISQSKDRVSILSPLGSLVLGCCVGNVVKGFPYGEEYYLIENILYQPEAAGDYHL
ncbi:MAG TPA: GreA/GreB family elongation factor [Spirochaetota bacterium]|nr:GreA/GreB family elongation factor [Spirochaetota bacterium]HPI90668.1 GreA/GreB family elongation factor [Spirochaetota bacterium]HPR49680.1 GreA/GreB family elongation factor [Spirochaetota bacterium]